MPFTIEITSQKPRTQVRLHVPAPMDQGFIWSLVATFKAHLAIRKLMRSLQETEEATWHLSDHMRDDIGLPPNPPPPRYLWEVRL